MSSRPEYCHNVVDGCLCGCVHGAKGYWQVCAWMCVCPCLSMQPIGSCTHQPNVRLTSCSPPDLPVPASPRLQAHSCYGKAGMVVGINHMRSVPATSENGYAVLPSVLEAAMAYDLALGLIPFFVMPTIGTTSSCAVDPVKEMTVIAHK